MARYRLNWGLVRTVGRLVGTEKHYRVFISHRTGDASGIALRIYERLTWKFGRNSVFYSVRSFRAGRNWRDDIRAAAGGCSLMIVVIGTEWLGKWVELEKNGGEDWVREEVSIAFERGVPVVPLFVDLEPKRFAASKPPGVFDDLTAVNGLSLRTRRLKDDIKEVVRKVPGTPVGYYRKSLTAAVVAVAIFVGAEQFAPSFLEKIASNPRAVATGAGQVATNAQSSAWITVAPKIGHGVDPVTVAGAGFRVGTSDVEQRLKCKVWVDSSGEIDVLTDDTGRFQTTFDPTRQTGGLGKLAVGEHTFHTFCAGRDAYATYTVAPDH